MEEATIADISRILWWEPVVVEGTIEKVMVGPLHSVYVLINDDESSQWAMMALPTGESLASIEGMIGEEARYSIENKRLPGPDYFPRKVATHFGLELKTGNNKRTINEIRGPM